MPHSFGGRYGRHITCCCFQFNHLGQSPSPAIAGGFSPPAGFLHLHSPCARSLTDCGAQAQGISELNSASITSGCMKMRPNPHFWVWRSNSPRRIGQGCRGRQGIVRIMLRSGMISPGLATRSRRMPPAEAWSCPIGVGAARLPSARKVGTGWF